MLISLNLIEKFVEIPWGSFPNGACTGESETGGVTLLTVVDLLTRQGFEVEAVKKYLDGLEDVVVGKIESATKHPSAEKLQLCKVNIGEKELVQIVCGAPNARSGLVVAVAKVGAKLPGDLLIKATQIRGVESFGMLCSRSELGLPVNLALDGDGIWELASLSSCGREESELLKYLGKPFAEALGLKDTLLDISLTPNRPDLLCHEGLAREIYVGLKHAGFATRWKNFGFAERGAKVTQSTQLGLFSSSLANKQLVFNGLNARQGLAADTCHFVVENEIGVSAFFCGLQDVAVVPSPGWLRAQLEALGQNSVNQLVDASNFVLLCFGQPSHAFDIEKIAPSGDLASESREETSIATAGSGEVPNCRRLFVRQAKPGENFLGLDGKQKPLTDQDCVVADKCDVHALLGVMGGEISKVKEGTSSIVLEFANPNAVAVRRTARRQGRKTDSSFLFEKGLNPVDRYRAALELIGLIAEVSPVSPKFVGVAGSVQKDLSVGELWWQKFVETSYATEGHSCPDVFALGRANGVVVDASVAFLGSANFAGNTPGVVRTSTNVTVSVGENFVPAYRVALGLDTIQQNLWEWASVSFASDSLRSLIGEQLVPFCSQLRILRDLGFILHKKDGLVVSGWDDPNVAELLIAPTQSQEDAGAHDGAMPFVELTLVTPPWRWHDREGTAGLVEEIVRVVGIDRVPAQALIGPVNAVADDPHLPLFERAASLLASVGYCELAGYHFMKEDDLQKLRLRSASALGEPLHIRNPIIKDQPLMQTSLIPHLLRSVQRNNSFGVQQGMIFQLSRTYQNLDIRAVRVFEDNGLVAEGLPDRLAAKSFQEVAGDQDLGEYAPRFALAYSREKNQENRPAETPRLAGMVFGDREPKTWYNTAPSKWSIHEVFAHIKHALLPFSIRLGWEKLPQSHPFFSAVHPGISAAVRLENGQAVGWIGQLHPQVLRNFEVQSSCIAFEINLALVFEASRGVHKVEKRVISPLRFPAVSKDFAFVLGENVSAAQVTQEVYAALEAWHIGRISDVRVFDVYRGKGIAEGKKSMAFNVRLEPAEKTFTDKELTQFQQLVIQRITMKLAGELRG